MKKFLSFIFIIVLIILVLFGVKYFIKEKEEVQINDNEKISEETIIEEPKELFEEYYKKSEKILKDMTIEEKVGQMFLVRYPTGKNVLEEIKAENPGGYILFAADFKDKTKDQIIKELKVNQENSKINMIFGVDEEGGTVTRVSRYENFRASKFKSPQALYEEGGLDLIIEDSKEKSALLKELGINMNLAPVVDTPTTSEAFIYARSYGRGAEETAKYSAEVIKTMNGDNMISVMKHFPGYGDNVDTHTGIAIDERNIEEFEEKDFLPFESGIEEGASSILVSHNVVKCMDENMPASLSKKAHDILREDLDFSGIIMTDDLAMDAVKEYVENGEAAVQAVLAGNDMIISSDFKNQKQEVLNAIENGVVSEEIIDEAVIRILACKYYYGIIK